MIHSVTLSNAAKLCDKIELDLKGNKIVEPFENKLSRPLYEKCLTYFLT